MHVALDSDGQLSLVRILPDLFTRKASQRVTAVTEQACIVVLPQPFWLELEVTTSTESQSCAWDVPTIPEAIDMASQTQALGADVQRKGLHGLPVRSRQTPRLRQSCCAAPSGMPRQMRQMSADAHFVCRCQHMEEGPRY